MSLPGLPSAAFWLPSSLRCLHGISSHMVSVSDRGVQFTARFWRALATAFGIKLNFSSAFHPQSNRQTQRVNQKVEWYLRTFNSAHEDDWVDLLPWSEFAPNNHANASTGEFPFFRVYGCHPSVPFSVAISAVVPAATETLQSWARSYIWEPPSTK